jgi:hypothetical protein
VAVGTGEASGVSVTVSVGSGIKTETFLNVGVAVSGCAVQAVKKRVIAQNLILIPLIISASFLGQLNYSKNKLNCRRNEQRWV